MARPTPGCQFAAKCALGPFNGGKPPAKDWKPPYRAPSVGDSVGETAAAFWKLCNFNALVQENGAQSRNRTSDTAIFSRMLYQLSYLGPGGA